MIRISYKTKTEFRGETKEIRRIVNVSSGISISNGVWEFKDSDGNLNRVQAENITGIIERND